MFALALPAFAFAHLADARAQSPTTTPFQPSVTDPRNANRFNAPLIKTREAIAREAAPTIPSGAGETGFDTTGAIAKKKKNKPKPGAPRPPPSPPPKPPGRRRPRAATRSRSRFPRASLIPMPTSRRTRRRAASSFRSAIRLSRSASAPGRSCSGLQSR